MPETDSPEQLDFMALARKRFEGAASDEKAIRDEAAKDLKFVAGDQWDPVIKAARGNRPALTFARCHTFVQQVSNEARQNKPQIKFDPSEDGDKDTAEVYEGLARHIQYSSDAQVAYETAVEYSAGGSFGYYRFLTDYCNNESWDLDLKIVPVLDPFAVYGILMPACFGQEPRYAFVIDEILREEFKALYPKSKICELGFDQAASRSGGDWVGSEKVRIAEYWYIKEEKSTIKRGEKERDITTRKVMFCKINGLEVIEGTETEWPGSTIPIIPVLGKQLFIDGKPNLFSVVRFQRGPQQLINVYKSRIAETLMVAPISPYMVAKGQLAGVEKQWQNMNNLPQIVEYNAVDVQGKLAPPPQRQVFEPPIQSLSEASAQEIDDMKATAGIFDASLGARSNEQSGTAIARRQQQSNITNMHFLDNLERAFKKGGIVIAELIPKIYDTARIIRILGEDEAPKVVTINKAYHDQESGKPRHYKVGGDGVGKYDVVVTMGRAFSTKRMESFDMMSQLVQGNPELLMSVGDILFQNADVAGAQQMAERFKKMLPPNLQDDKDQEIPPQAQAAIAQSQQQLQALNAYAQKVEGEKQQLEMEKQAKVVDNEYKLALERMKIEAQITMAEINTKAQEASTRMKLEADMMSKLHVSAHQRATQGVQQAHESQMAEVGHQQALEQQDQAGQQVMQQQVMAQNNDAQQDGA